jgi:hypothetical protein
MSILLPYKFTQRDTKYSFQTDNSVVYSVEFTDGSLYFHDLPTHIPVFELNIKALNAVDNLGQPYDKRVEITIVTILNTFFSDNKNSLLYVCDNLDNRQQGRYRKFDIWFEKNKTTLIEKYDVNFTTHGTQIIASLIVHAHNPDKELLVSLFLDLYK